MEAIRHEGNGRMSKAVVYNGVVYVSGQTARDAGNSVKAQTEAVLGKVEEILTKYGSGKDKLLSATVYITDMDFFDEMNSVWDKWVVPGCEPTRACVQAGLVSGILVEVVVTAAVQ